MSYRVTMSREKHQNKAMDTIARVLELMGSTPDHVAATLRGGHISGLRHSNPDMNPVVRYLQQTLDLNAYLGIGSDCATLFLFHEEGIRELELPAPVRVFLERFNSGMYPNLERTSYRASGTR